MKRGKLFVKIKATGDGAERIAVAAMERKIFAKNVKYVKNGCFLTIDAVDEQKFFAISRNMCYNVERIGYTGRFAFFKKLLKSAGAVFGAAAFITFVCLCDAVVGEIVYKGDAAAFRRQIVSVLKLNGVEKGKICKADCSSLGEKIVISTDGISYATVTKSGRRIIVDVKSDEEKLDPIDVSKDEILSPADGKILRLNVLSGIAVVKIGDEVKKGQPIISGQYVHDDKTIKTYALGEAVIETKFVYEYESAGKGKQYENRAVALGKAKLGETEIISTAVELDESGEKIIYRAIFTVAVTVK
ncbi:MAG: sporulation protein YqfD [Candidatus Borkfalkiaceae bacterium]|nr:sporulation protein YqfD [Eubacteriales bacterium]MDY5820821.1 sporulation protein YqfD [Christensenellaceae bacterium]